jgi:glycosyltransferase involved in cell wall biosynthesis
MLSTTVSTTVTAMFNPCVLIPVYDHEHAVEAVVRAVLAHGVRCILVDDGSAPGCAGVLDGVALAHPQQVTLLRHAENQGKGAAMLTGFRYASGAGYTHLLQIDADGQHCVADIPRFLEHARLHLDAVIVGYPVYDASVPALRLYARYLTHLCVWLNTLSFDIKDSMCGFRVYPLAPVLALISRRNIGRRMNFDTDILVRLYWDGLAMVNAPTRVRYPSDGVSHFRLWFDNVLITRMHLTLLCGMLLRLPVLLARKWRRS